MQTATAPRILPVPSVTPPLLNPSKLSVPDFIRSTALEKARGQYALPSVIHDIIDFLGNTNLFLYYRTYKLTTYANPRNAVVAGGVLHSGAKLMGASVALKTALYVKCTLDLTERYGAVSESCQQFNEARRWSYPVYRPVAWNFHENKISPSLSIWWHTTGKKYRDQTWKVIVCSAKVGWEVFKSGLFLRDLVLLTKDDAAIEFYACTDLVENIGKYGNDLKSNVKLLVEQLRSNEGMANQLLAKMGITVNIGNVIHDLVVQNPGVFAEVEKQVEGAKEDLRGILERGEISLAEGLDRPSTIPEDKFVPWMGEREVDQAYAAANPDVGRESEGLKGRVINPSAFAPQFSARNFIVGIGSIARTLSGTFFGGKN